MSYYDYHPNKDIYEFKFLVNEPIIEKLLIRNRYDNVILIMNKTLSDSLMDSFKEYSYAAVLLWFEENGREDIIIQTLKDAGIKYQYYGSHSTYLIKDGENPASAKEAFYEKLASILPVLIDEANNEGLVLNKNLTERCGNCHLKMADDDNFCPYCGTRKGEGAFIPWRNAFTGAMYGPPTITKYACPDCGFTWSEISTGRNNMHYCNKCGTKGSVIDEKGYLENVFSEDFFKWPFD